MNLAVDPDHWRKGIGRTAARAPLRRHRARSRARHHARGARLERGRDPPLPLARLPAHRHPARLLHRQPRGRADHVAGSAERPLGPVILAHRDLLRRHLRGRRRRGTGDVRAASARRRPTCTRASAASCPRSRRGATSSSSCPVIEAALADARRDARRRGRRRGDAGARTDRRAARRALDRQGAGVRAPPAARAGRPPARARRGAAARAARPASRRSRACWPRAGTRSCSTWPTTRPPLRLGGTRDDAAGEAFDKGARLLGLSDAGRRGARAASRATAIPRASRSRSCCAGRTGTISRSRGSRRRSCAACASSATGCRTRAPISPRAIRPRSCGSSSSAPWRRSTRRAARRSRVVGGVAANGVAARRAGRGLRARGARLCLLPPALCVDNAAMIAAAALAGARAGAAGVPRARRLRAQPAGRVGARRAPSGAAGRVPSSGHDAPPPLAHAHARSLAGGNARGRRRAPRPRRARPAAAGAALVGRRDRRRPLGPDAAAAGDHRAGGAAGGLRSRAPEASKTAAATQQLDLDALTRAGIWMSIQYRFVNALNAVSATVRPDQVAQLRALARGRGRVSGAHGSTRRPRWPGTWPRWAPTRARSRPAAATARA